MILDAPYPPPFPLHTATSRITAASAALITPSKNSTNSNMEEDAVIENVVVDPMEDIVADPDPYLDAEEGGKAGG